MKLALRIAVGTTLSFFFIYSIHLFRKPEDAAFGGKLASQWAEDLLSRDYSIRDTAKSAFVQLGEPGVPQLREMLRRRNGRWENFLAAASERLPIQYKVRNSEMERRRATEVVSLLGSKAGAALPELIPGLAEATLAADTERALLKIGGASEPVLREATRHPETAIRERAAKLLREFKPMNPETRDALMKACADHGPDVRAQAASSLGDSLRGDAEIDDLLLKLTRDTNENVRAAAGEALGKGKGGAAANERLREMLEDSSVVVRLRAARALWLLSGDVKVVLPTLIDLVDSSEGWQAAFTLADLRESAAPAVPALIEALRNERVPRPFRNPPSAAFALGRIGRAAVGPLCELLGEANSPARIGAVMALSFMGPEGAPAAPRLIQLLKDRDREVRHTTALTLATIGADREIVIPALVECLQAEDVNMRMTAGEQLKRIAPEGNWIVSLE